MRYIAPNRAARNLWLFLDTLALAQHSMGDTAEAITTQKRILSLIPVSAGESDREELESNLHTYEAALAETGDSAATQPVEEAEVTGGDDQ